MDIAPANAKIIDNQTGQSQYTVGTAIMIPAKPIMGDERSNSPAIIRRQAPIAISIQAGRRQYSNSKFRQEFRMFHLCKAEKDKNNYSSGNGTQFRFIQLSAEKGTSLRRSSELA